MGMMHHVVAVVRIGLRVYNYTNPNELHSSK